MIFQFAELKNTTIIHDSFFSLQFSVTPTRTRTANGRPYGAGGLVAHTVRRYIP